MPVMMSPRRIARRLNSLIFKLAGTYGLNFGFESFADKLVCVLMQESSG
jgi:hypothetical protein